MEKVLDAKPTLDEVMQDLRDHFPNYKIKTPWLNNKVILVQKGAVLATIKNGGNRTYKVSGGLNTQNLGVALGIGIGVVFGFIGALIIAGIIYLVNQTKINNFKIEIEDFINEKYS